MAKYTFQVEIDGRQAQQEAKKLREALTKEMGAIDLGQSRGGQAAPAQAVATVAKEMEKIGKVDLTQPIQQLREELAKLSKEIARTESDLQSSVFKMGRDFDRDTMGLKKRDPGERRQEIQPDFDPRQRYTYDDKIQINQYEASLAQFQAESARIQREIVERTAREYLDQMENYANAGIPGDDPDMQRLQAMYDQAGEDVGRLLREEIEFQENAEKARQEYLALLEEANRRQRDGSLTTTRTGAAIDGGSVEAGTIRQTFTVHKNSVQNAADAADNIERMERAAKGYAEWTEKGAKAAGSVSFFAGENAKAAEGARASAQIAIEKEQQKTAVANAESRERIATANTESREKIDASKRATAMAVADAETIKAVEQRKTAMVKSNLLEQDEAQKRLTLQEKRRNAEQLQQFRLDLLERRRAVEAEGRKLGALGGGGMGMGGMGSRLAYGVMGALGIYSADQVARQLYSAGRTGAMQIRQRDTFESISGAAGQSADALIRAVQKASRGTINETQAMALASQVMAQKFAASTSDIDESLATLTRAARKYSQVFTDEQGAFLTTEEIFARLIKFVREGNKELVDQFGISNARIADVLDMPIDGLASATGAADRFRGLIEILEEDLARLGEAQDSMADTIEASESRISESLNRIRRRLAPTSAAVAEYFADLIDPAGMTADAAGSASTDKIIDTIARQAEEQRRSISRMLSLTMAGGVYERNLGPNADRLERLQDLLTRATHAANLGVPGAERYADALRKIGEEAATTGEVLRQYDEDLASAQFFLDYEAPGALANRERMMQGAPDPLFAETGGARSLEQYEASAARAMQTVEALAELIAHADDAVEAGVPNAQDYADRLRDIAAEARDTGKLLPAHIAQIAEAGRWYNTTARDAIILAQAIGQIATAAYGVGPALTALMSTGGLTKDGLIRSPTSPAGFLQTQESIKAGAQSEEDRFQAQVAILQNQNQADRIAYQFEYQKAQAAKDAWERAAKSAADAWASELKSALQSVPGLFGTSEVTAEDMQNAELGIYEEKADEYLRQLRDEVRNGKDYAGVDISDAAARLGIDPNQDPEVILRKFEQAWQDSSLFAGGANLDLINEEAVQRELDRQRKSAEGRSAIEQYFGLPPEDTGGPVGAAAGGAFVETAAEAAPAIGAAITEGMTEGGDIMARNLIPVDGGVIRTVGGVQVDRLIFPASTIPNLPRLTVGALDLPPEGVTAQGRVTLETVTIGEQAMADIQAQLAGLTVGAPTTEENPAAFDWSQFGLDKEDDRGTQIGADLAGQALAGFTAFDFDGMARAMVTAFSTQVSGDTYRDAAQETGRTVARYIMTGARDGDLLEDLAQRFMDDLFQAIADAMAGEDGGDGGGE